MENKENYTCEFCNKTLKTEKAFANHLCEKKRRWFRKNDKSVVIGFRTWQEFRKLNKLRGKNDYNAFMNNRLYTSFVKFGVHIQKINAIDPDSFIKFILKNAVKIDDWCTDRVYETYLREWYKKQPPEKSFEQNVLLMEQWGKEHNENWNDFFKKVNTNKAVQYIKMGRISPWVLYNSQTGTELMSRFSDEQIELILDYVNPKFWKLKFTRSKSDVEWVTNICKKYNL